MSSAIIFVEFAQSTSSSYLSNYCTLIRSRTATLSAISRLGNAVTAELL